MSTLVIEPRLNSVQCLRVNQLPQMAYWEWGNPQNTKVLLCLHGLTRQGRDFDSLAQALVDEYRVVCPDIVGRGQSHWLQDPNGYQLFAYLADIITLLARLQAKTLHVVGTSMGGLIGLALAAIEHSAVERLVINDIGPHIPPAALMRIAAYLGKHYWWQQEAQALAELQDMFAPFGPHTEQQWELLLRPMLKSVAQGPDLSLGYTLHYDPQIAKVFTELTHNLQTLAINEALLWQAYEKIVCPTLLLRGAQSDLLLLETAQAMTQRGPCARLHQFEGVGHAPSLVQAQQIAVVRQFLWC